jgi:hypothetical protein
MIYLSPRRRPRALVRSTVGGLVKANQSRLGQLTAGMISYGEAIAGGV